MPGNRVVRDEVPVGPHVWDGGKVGAEILRFVRGGGEVAVEMCWHVWESRRCTELARGAGWEEGVRGRRGEDCERRTKAGTLGAAGVDGCERVSAPKTASL